MRKRRGGENRKFSQRKGAQTNPSHIIAERIFNRCNFLVDFTPFKAFPGTYKNASPNK
jgi:hypothetical protein